ncbi:MAG TPA: hypothetical protein VMY77_14520 [Chitinophagaceae bacterium]|nr:hypothetical protein [Chitinophagaceae bacterium]
MRDKSHEYKMGYDCGLHGANTTNCHFSLFATPARLKEWESGKAAGENKKNGIIKKLSLKQKQ